MFNIWSSNEENTIDIGRVVGKLSQKGLVILLNGNLGAGKTHFVKGLAEGLGIKEMITSPTFNIFNVYENNNGFNLNHFDVYRVHDEDEILDIGFEDYIYSDDVSVIEWPSLITGILPLDNINIDINHTDDLNKRNIVFTFNGNTKPLEKEWEKKFDEYISD